MKQKHTQTYYLNQHVQTADTSVHDSAQEL